MMGLVNLKFSTLEFSFPHALQAKHDRILRVSAEFPKRAGLLSFQVQSSYTPHQRLASLVNWHERSALQSVAVQAVDWQRL